MKRSDIAAIIGRISLKRCVEFLSEMVRTDSVNLFGSEDQAKTDLARYLSGNLSKLFRS